MPPRGIELENICGSGSGGRWILRLACGCLIGQDGDGHQPACVSDSTVTKEFNQCLMNLQDTPVLARICRHDRRICGGNSILLTRRPHVGPTRCPRGRRRGSCLATSYTLGQGSLKLGSRLRMRKTFSSWLALNYWHGPGHVSRDQYCRGPCNGPSPSSSRPSNRRRGA